MAISMGTVRYSSPPWMGEGKNVSRRRRGDVRCSAAAGGLMVQYQTLRVQPGADQKEVKKAFRQLALQYHPDVCKGTDCGAKFQRINEAYDIVMNSLRAGEEEPEEQEWEPEGEEWSAEGGVYCDGSWDMWEEWMGWEGAGIMDYSSHINPYI